ncbi:MAG: membrane dipeptidase [Proteobacteria bacterium]|nr:membrane dipeptidase [Pseudomonadota bacterium]
MKRALRVLGAVVLLSAGIGVALGWNVERFLNRVEPVPLPVVGDAARRLHDATTVVDLHADSLLLERDLLKRGRVGHVDLPRLQEGGVGLQFLGVVTRAHVGTNPVRTDPSGLDALTLLGWARMNGYGWKGPLARAQLQADWWEAFAARSEGRLVPVRDRRELAALLARRRGDRRIVGTVLAVEGGHVLQGELTAVDALYARGYRSIGLTHFFDNALGGSAHGLEKGGLTPFGRRVIERMSELGMIVDLAHASPKLFDDALDHLQRPTVISHGGVQGTCPGPRNLSDDQVRRIAAGGGVVGIGYFPLAVCGTELSHIVAAIRHVVDLVGDEHVALGSDYDGATTVGFDTSRLPALTQALLDAGLAPSSVRKILGENVLRVLRQVLPVETDPAVGNLAAPGSSATPAALVTNETMW